MAYRHLLFDLDRTLWDFDGNALQTFARMFDHYHIRELCHTDLDTFHRIYHTINESLWEAYRNGTTTKETLRVKRFSLTLEHFNAPHSIIGMLAGQMSEYYISQNTLMTGLMPGAKELLEYLNGKGCYTMSIITNGFREAQLPKMSHSGLNQYFKQIFLSEEIGYQKPDRRFFDTVLARLRADADECIVIGDDFKVDIQGAYECGIDQIFYNVNATKVRDITPTHEVSSLLLIKEIL